MGSEDLKRVAKSWELRAGSWELPAPMDVIYEIYERYHSCEEIDILFNNPVVLAYEIVTKFRYASVFDNETDIKNLHLFMSAVSDFLNDPLGYTADLDGFIRFADDCREKKNKKQSTTNEKNAVQLLTIHKSKGLDFDTVFVYFDSTKVNASRSVIELDYLIDKENYSRISHCFLTMNYKCILRELFPDEFQEIEQKRAIEEINNLYVAMTRAKTNMGVFWVYKEKDLVEEKNLKCKITRNAKEIAEAKPERYMMVSHIMYENKSNRKGCNYSAFSYYKLGLFWS